MEFYIRVRGVPARLAIFPGAFNPPTRAHLAMAESALALADEVLFVLPRVFPHKQYRGAPFAERLEMLQAALAGHPRFSLAATDRGLFIDIARQARLEYGDHTRLSLLCGRDAAERMVNWEYGAAESIQQQLELFELLVASRGGDYEPPPEIRHRVRSIALACEVAGISSTELRRRIREGQPWQDLTPDAVVPLIQRRIELWRRGDRSVVE